MEITVLDISPESPVAGKTLSQINIRHDYGTTVLAIRRQREILANPSGNTDIRPGDGVVVMDAAGDITRLSLLFEPENNPGQV